MLRLVVFSCLFLAAFAVPHHQTKPNEERIIGGHDTDISQVPHQVSVQYNGKHICGGSVIGPQNILTAAHCVEGKDENLFSVRVGSSYHNKEGKVIKVVKVTSHPNYNTYIVDYDAAVLLLEEYLTSDLTVTIVTLANVEPEEGEMALISGWGSTKEGINASEILQSVSVPVVSKEKCKDMYRSRDEITDQMFCAGFMSGGKDSCQGDNGGPAMVDGNLAGIVSWGDSCADGNVPGVYTSISSIVDWISDQIAK